MSASVRQYKAPYRYARKGRTLVLMERGNATGQTFSSEANAKRTVLELNDAWRAKSAKKANPRPPMRRNFFGIFKSAPPLYRVTAYNRDGSTDVHTATSHPALEIALDEAGIKERAIPGLMAAAEQRPLVDSSGDVFKRMKDAYGWERVTIELVGERPKAKSNPKKYYEGSPDVSESQPYAVKDIRKGEFVKKKKGARKTYIVEGYDRMNRKYALQDMDDISRTIYVKGDALVYFGD